MADPRGRYRQALGSRELRWVLVASFVDQAGSWAYNVVLSAYIFGRTGSPGWVAAFLSMRWIIAFLGSGPAGVISDRYERRRIVQTGALCAGVLTTVLTLLVALNRPLWSLLLCVAAISVAAAVNNPAAGALLPDLVPERDLAAANALRASLDNVVVLIGPALGGVLLLTGSAAAGIAVNAARFLLAAAIYTRIRTSSRGNARAGGSMVAQFAAGWRVLIAHRAAFVLVLYLVLDSAVFGAAAVFYGPLSEHLGTGPNGYSYLIAAQALGGVLGATVAERLATRQRLAPVIIGGFAVECLPLAFVTASGLPVVAAALQVLFGIGMVIIDVAGLTALQRDLPRGMLGRANAIMIGMVAGATAAASLIATALLSALGLSATVVIVGVGFPVLALLGLPILLGTDRATLARAAGIDTRIELLRALDMFGGAGRPELQRLATVATERTAHPGSVIVRQGEPADAIWLLAEGTLNVAVMRDGQLDYRPEVHAPNYVGEIGVLHGIARTATVTAATECRLLRIDATDFAAAVESASWSRSLLAIASERFAAPRMSPAAS